MKINTDTLKGVAAILFFLIISFKIGTIAMNKGAAEAITYGLIVHCITFIAVLFTSLLGIVSKQNYNVE